MTTPSPAQAAWAALMGAGGAQDRTPGETRTADLPAPTSVRAVTGRDQVTVTWDPVPGAIGYAVYRADTADGPFTVADFGGGDVLAVPHGPFADTTDTRGGCYAVAALATVTALGPLSAPAPVTDGDTSAQVQITIGATGTPIHRLWRAMIGSEHLTHLLSTDHTGGRPIGTGLHDALARAHHELHIAEVRAHGILSAPFDQVDTVYDQILALGYRPVVELGFMPPDLARDPTQTVFAYEGIISPPADWDRWAGHLRAFAAHLADRYGHDEISHWKFEVWNEANLSVFWSGTPDEYWRLYDTTAAALAPLAVGGPATAAAGWITEQTTRDNVAFLSTHVYGTAPLDLRPLAGGKPLLWTEWGVTATHGHPINDSVFAATFLLRGMRSAAGRVDALAPWVISDHFEELGRPQRLIHGGFGLLTVGNLAKPKYWALRLLDRLGDTELPVTATGDGAGSLIQAWAATSAPGTTSVLIWNGTLDQSKAGGTPGLDRLVRLQVPGHAPGTDCQARTWRVDQRHNNVAARWAALGGGADWPDDDQWHTLTADDRLDEAEPARTLTAGPDGTLTLELDLPNPGIALIEIQPKP
ncbi:xylan 1,4-beta-xylosidase [Actinoplanes sp. NPDC049265]|uniref:GH39 family glycosyl hydrolase n=1 Tax=Actinoplanes sp. NPDC049265 TaxID=3363902 RepID=UPI003712A21B